jgi:hypothetical protein
MRAMKNESKAKDRRRRIEIDNLPGLHRTTAQGMPCPLLYF